MRGGLHRSRKHRQEQENKERTTNHHVHSNVQLGDMLQRRLDLRRAITVRPYAQGRVVPIQDIVENLTVVRRRVAHRLCRRSTLTWFL